MLTWLNHRFRAEYSSLSPSETRGRSPCCCRCVLIPETARALLILSEFDQAVPGMKASLDNLREELISRGFETVTCIAPDFSQLLAALDALLLPPLPSLLLIVVVAPTDDAAPVIRISKRAPLSVGMLLYRISSANVPKIVVLDSADNPVVISPDPLRDYPDVYMMFGGRARRSTDSSTCLSNVSLASTASEDPGSYTAIDDGVSDENENDCANFKHFVAGAPSATGFIIGHARGRTGHLVVDECDSLNPTYSLVDDVLAELRAHPTNHQPLYLDVLLGGVVRRSTSSAPIRHGKGTVPYAMSSMRRVVAIPPRRE